MKFSRLELHYFIGRLTLALMLMPWISFRIIETDTQPWFIFSAILFSTIFFKRDVPLSIGGTILLPCYTILLCLCSGDMGFLALRAILSYGSFFLCALSYFIYRSRIGSPIRTIGVINCIWLLAGGIQSIFGPYTLDFLVEVRTTEGRGVTGLAPEPSFFAIQLFFLSWLLLSETNYKPSAKLSFLIALNCLAIVLVAKSALGIIFIGISLMTIIFIQIINLRLRKEILIVCFSAIIIILSSYSVLSPESRLLKLARGLEHGVGTRVLNDQSATDRYLSIAAPITMTLYDLGIPHGITQYSDDYAKFLHQNHYYSRIDGNKIMSGIGALLYELGWFSWPFFYFLVGSLKKMPTTKGIATAFVFVVVYLNAIPIAFPLVPILITSFYFQGQLVTTCGSRYSLLKPTADTSHTKEHIEST